MTLVRLPPHEFSTLEAEVRTRLDQNDLDALVTPMGRPLAGLVALPMKWGPLVTSTLDGAQQGEWMGELLEAILARPGTGPSLRTTCERALHLWREAQRAAAPYAPSGRRSNALLLFNKAPFVDRATERPLIEQIVRQVAQRVLVVRGDPAVGKSHLSHFVRHLVDEHSGTRLATLRLDEMDVDLVGALDVMSELAALMDLDPDPRWDRLAQEQRQAGKLARWLTGQTQAFAGTGAHWVVVLDGVNHAKVGPGAVELIDQLIMAGARGDLVNTSLIVLALGSQVPPSVVNDVIVKDLLPLTGTDLRDYVSNLALTLGMKADPEDLEAVESYVVERLAFPLDHAGMKTLRERLTRLPDELLRAAS